MHRAKHGVRAGGTAFIVTFRAPPFQGREDEKARVLFYASFPLSRHIE